MALMPPTESHEIESPLEIGMSLTDFEALFSFAESYLQMWEKTWKAAYGNKSNP